MKIAILTHPQFANYGGILQAYALQSTLEELGHCVDEIEITPHFDNYKMKLSWWAYPIAIPKRIIRRVILRDKRPILWERYHNNIILPLYIEQFDTTCRYTREFTEKYMHRVIVKSFGELKERGYEAIIVGSDQVWRVQYANVLHGNIENVFLKFAENWNIKRIAYAASFGSSAWEGNTFETKECSRLLAKFDAVSVRELDGIEICKKYLNYSKAIHMIDPVFLLSKEKYVKLFNDANTPKSNGNLLYYLLNETPEKIDFVNTQASFLGLSPFKVGSKFDVTTAPLEERIQPAIEVWLRGLFDSDFVITDSFHACAFAIIFNKPFVVIANKIRGVSRFNSLLGLFGLTNRLIAEDDLGNIQTLPEIDYEPINEKISLLKKLSFAFLIKNL